VALQKKLSSHGKQLPQDASSVEHTSCFGHFLDSNCVQATKSHAFSQLLQDSSCSCSQGTLIEVILVIMNNWQPSSLDEGCLPKIME